MKPQRKEKKMSLEFKELVDLYRATLEKGEDAAIVAAESHYADLMLKAMRQKTKDEDIKLNETQMQTSWSIVEGALKEVVK